MQKLGPALESGPLPLKSIRDAARRDLFDALDAIPGRKALVLEPDFAAPLSLLADAAALRERGVEAFCALDAGAPSPAPALAARGVRAVVYLVRSPIEGVQAAAAHAAACRAAAAGRGRRGAAAGDGGLEFALLLAPRAWRCAPLLLEEAGLAADVPVRAVPRLDWVPLDDDVLSLEVGSAYRELAVEGDPAVLRRLAEALHRLQGWAAGGGGAGGAAGGGGAAPRLVGKGAWADGVRAILARLRREDAAAAAPAGGGGGGGGGGAPPPALAAAAAAGGIDAVVLLDRSVDVVTPMLTQLTYEGLLDEVLGLAYGQVRQPGGGSAADAAGSPAGTADAAAGGPTTPQQAKVYGLNSGDAVFREARDRPYLAARRWLNETLRAIQAFRGGGMAAADLGALRGFVAGLRDKFARLPLHSALVERLGAALSAPAFLARQRAEAALLDGRDTPPAVGELAAGGEGLLPVLRLLVLHAAVAGGAPRRAHDAARREVLEAYGAGAAPLLGALGAAGLLRARDGGRRPWFPAARDAFSLLAPEGEAPDDGDAPRDVHFAYAGYAPLSVRLVQRALAGGLPPGDAAVAALPGGPHFDVAQGVDDAGRPVERPWSGRDAATAAAAAAAAQGDGGGGGTPAARRRTVVVAFIGGVTYAEVSALRFLGRSGLLGPAPVDFIVATTGMVNGDTLLASLAPPPL